MVPPMEHRFIADLAINKEMGYLIMGIVFGVRIFCYGLAGRALTLELERPMAERVCWK